MKLTLFSLGICLLLTDFCLAEAKTLIRIGVQANGTAAWELTALQDIDPSLQADFTLEPHPIANAEAGKIALQSGSVDIIITDWLWVSRLRASGADFTFYPYSNTSGALVVANDSSIHSLADLKGKKIGIAGGELDKNWLLLQALGHKQQIDLNAANEKVFAAPPLISEQLTQKRIDAALTYWHFAAQLESSGNYRQLMDGRDILKGLGIQEHLANLGYVFKQSWGDQHKSALLSFFKASKQAKTQLCQSESAWLKLAPLLPADNPASQKKLRQRYCEGAVSQSGESQIQAAHHIYRLLSQVSKQQLTGPSETLSPGTFWLTQ